MATTGTLTAAGSITLTKPPTDATTKIQVSGNYTGLSFVVEGSLDGTNFAPISSIREDSSVLVPGGTAISPTDATVISVRCASDVYVAVRARVTAISTLSATFTLVSAQIPNSGAFPQVTLATAAPAIAGGSTGTFQPQGNVNRQSSQAGIGNGADTTDDVLFTYTLPANALDIANRQIAIVADGLLAANGNNKRIKIWFGGTVVADTGVITGNAVGWNVLALVTKTGAAASNTQRAQGQSMSGATHGGCTAPSSPTETESGAIVIKVTGSSPTTGAASDVLGMFFEVNFMN